MQTTEYAVTMRFNDGREQTVHLMAKNADHAQEGLLDHLRLQRQVAGTIISIRSVD